MALMQMPAFRAGKVCLSAESGARNGALNVSSWGFSGYRCNLEGALRCQQQACIAELENLPTFSGRVRSLVAPSLQRSRRWGKPIVGDVYGRGGQVSFVEGRNGTLDFRIRAEESTSEAVTDWEPIATAAAASMAAQMLASEDEQATTPESSHADGEDTDGASRHRAVKAQVQTSKRPASKLGGRAQTNGAAAREHLVQDLISGHDHAIPLGRSASRGGPLKVAVDVDEVLCSFLATLNIYCAEAYAMHYDVSQYHVYDFRKIWNCSQEEANQKVHDFFQSRHFTSGIPPIPGAYEALQRLSILCSLVVVTSRQHCIQEPSRRWIDAHYPELFEEIHFGNHFALEGVARPKSEICKSIGARVLIDDNPRYAVECAEAGIHVLLFDWNHAYPWSKTSDGPVHPLIQRVRDWTEVEAALQKLALNAVESGEGREVSAQPL